MFPVIYDGVRHLYHYFGSLPPGGSDLFFSAYQWTILSPFVDKLSLGLVLFTLWAGYYFTIAGIRGISGGSYGLRFMAIDLFAAMVLFFAARSLQNIDEKTFLEKDSTWILLSVAIALYLIRVVTGSFSIKFRQHSEILRFVAWSHLLVDLARWSALLVACTSIGFLFDRNVLGANDVLRAVWGGLTVYAGAIILLLGSIHLLRRHRDNTKAYAEEWESAWVQHRLSLLIHLVVAIVVLGASYALRNHLALVVVRWRNVLPWGALVLLLVATALTLLAISVRPLLLDQDRASEIRAKLLVLTSLLKVRIHAKPLLTVVDRRYGRITASWRKRGSRRVRSYSRRVADTIMRRADSVVDGAPTLYSSGLPTTDGTCRLAIDGYDAARDPAVLATVARVDETGAPTGILIVAVCSDEASELDTRAIHEWTREAAKLVAAPLPAA